MKITVRGSDEKLRNLKYFLSVRFKDLDFNDAFIEILIIKAYYQRDELLNYISAYCDGAGITYSIG